MQQTLIGIVVVLLLVWLVLRLRSKSDKPDDPATDTPAKKTTAYHAVSIKFEKNACEAAREMSGRRFLSSAAPRLPLPECDVLECRCRFAHHSDRRSSKDRRSPFAAAGFGSGTGSFEKERREKQDRRKSADLDDF